MARQRRGLGSYDYYSTPGGGYLAKTPPEEDTADSGGTTYYPSPAGSAATGPARTSTDLPEDTSLPAESPVPAETGTSVGPRMSMGWALVVVAAVAVFAMMGSDKER